MEEMNMFCYQCEQTAQGKGCTKVGVCGKDPDVAALQNLTMYAADAYGSTVDIGVSKTVYFTNTLKRSLSQQNLSLPLLEPEWLLWV